MNFIQLQNPLPPGFCEHEFEHEFHLPLSREQAFAWLCDPKTFTRGQIPPWGVEFLGGGFETGATNWHYGPFLNFPGILTEVRAPEYRDLRYFYGAYVLSPRLVRPTRLEFWFDPLAEKKSRVRLRVSAQVRRGFGIFWSLSQWLFWPQFGWNFWILARLGWAKHLRLPS
ncbi:MAG: hypothetical protein RJB38_448 [Pseudomonadota bacterium]|jgi:hypothetical protein